MNKLKAIFIILILVAMQGVVFAEYNLNFNGGDGGIFDTGFTQTLNGTDGTDLSLLNLTGGELIVTTANGEPISGGTAEEYNYLAVPWDLSSSFSAYCKINNPQVLDNFDQGGIFVGTDADNWVKTTAVSFSGNNAISSIYEVAGNPNHGAEQFVAHGLINTAQTVELWLEGDGTGNVTAFYAIDGASRNQTTSFNIPSVLGASGYAGLWTTNAGLTGSGTYGTTVDIHYEQFTVTPEPTTVLLVGLGGVLLRRKSKNQK